MRKRKFGLKRVLLFFLIIYVSVIIIKQEVTSYKISKEISKAKTELDSVQGTNQQLKDELDMANTDLDKYRQNKAREELGYIKQGETPVKSQGESK